MATYSFHRLIIGKVKNYIFSVSMGILGILFLQKCLLSSPPYFIWFLSKSLNLIGCQGDKMGKFYKKINNLLPRNHKVDEADTFHIC